MTYPCTQCGACCRRVNQAVENLNAVGVAEDHPLYFPYKWDETGRCEMLTDDNQCKVYADRPTLCNVDKMIELSGMDKHTAYSSSIRICNQLMDEDGLPSKFRIPNYLPKWEEVPDNQAIYQWQRRLKMARSKWHNIPNENNRTYTTKLGDDKYYFRCLILPK